MQAPELRYVAPRNVQAPEKPPPRASTGLQAQAPGHSPQRRIPARQPAIFIFALKTFIKKFYVFGSLSLCHLQIIPI